MNYGFLIRNDRCIGCHACSTACKSENQVPLGVYRTWVKSVEVGVYPNVRRHFQVTRCNHCANPPCVRICPVTAMYQRDDGIVEFDPEVCIGCKACLQACPYDAIYVDPETGTAAKCHFCAHRIELGLEPACVVVCPEHAIIAGDLDDPNSEISRMLAELEVTVRKPEQGTAPKLFYVEGNDANLTPTAVDAHPPTFAWADVWEAHAEAPAGDGMPAHHAPTRRSDTGTPIRTPGPQGIPEPGPIFIGEGRMAGQMTQVAYNVQHRIPWHWPVPAYLVTKAISAGLFLLVALGVLLGVVPALASTLQWAGLGSLLFLGITTGLLVYDLERPERFLRIILRPQWKSWLARGAFLLVGFGTIVGLWWLLEVGGMLEWWAEPTALRPVLLGVGIPLAIMAAIYTAFLFAQAEGRDLWQSALLPIHLLVQAALAGSAFALLVAPWLDWGSSLVTLARWTFGISLGLDLLIILLGEFGMPHASEVAARAAHRITHGPYRHHFWMGALLLGHLVPLGLLGLGGVWLEALAALLALIGLYLYEHAFVMAPQEIPNS